MDKILFTDRLILRPPTYADIPSIAEGRNSEFVLKYNLYPVADDEMIKDEIDMIESVLLVLRESGDVIGCIYIKDDFLRYRVKSKEIAGWIKPTYSACGFMTEAVLSLMSYLFGEGGQDRLTARVFSENKPSIGIMAKLGFVKEGYLPSAAVSDDGRLFDLVLFSIAKDDFFKSSGQENK